MPKQSRKKSQADYVPLHKDDVKFSVEIPVKEIKDTDIIRIEKQGKKKPKIGKLKTRKTREVYKKEGIKEKPETKSDEDSTLIITEKPQAAAKIASALGNFKKYSENKVPYYELEREGKKIIVSCAVGHLFNLKSNEKGFPVFNIEWQPNYKIKKQDWSKRYYSLLSKLCKKASKFIVATDYDIEGEVIGWNVLRFICGKNADKKAERMKFSTLTEKELEKAYSNLLQTIDWGQAIAGETRHYLDWMYGINLSRALMSAIKSAGRFKIMSIGRVQGPTLKLIVDKELEILKFKPEPYFQIFIKLKEHKLLLKYEKDIKKRKELDKFKDLKGQEGKASTQKSERELPPPFPFDLTSLQREAYRLYKITPSRTLQLAQNLYLSGVISYPRTSSQKIPPEIQPLKILNKLKARFKETSYITRKKPVEGGKSDPAHPSIYPTGDFGKTTDEESKIYSLIVKRFISCFCSNALIENKKITFITDRDKLKFIAKGLEVKEKAWMNVYPAIIKEQEIEDIEGEKTIEKSNIEEKMTQPPRRYTPASIITELEKRNLGTKATRSAIIETLYNRNYIQGQSITATPLGVSLISTLEKNSPEIIDEKLTRHFEKEMEAIQTAKKNLVNLQDITLKEAKKTIIEISNDFKKNQEKIGEELVKATEEHWKKEKEENTIGECPVCKKGNLIIKYGRKYKRYFVGCSNYPECKAAFSLPPNGVIKAFKDKEGKSVKCDKCSFPLLIRLSKGKKPWIFCFNIECETNRKRVEEYRKKQESESEK